MDSELAYTLEGLGEQLQQLIDQTEVANSVKSCGIFFLGLIAGLLFMRIFWDRF